MMSKELDIKRLEKMRDFIKENGVDFCFANTKNAIIGYETIVNVLAYIENLEQKISKAIKRIEDLRQYFDEDVQADFVLILDILDGRLSK